MPASIIRFLNQVSAQPNHPAVVQDDRIVTYSELGILCRRIAQSILAHGEQPRVAIALPAGPEAYASFFAALMAGGYYAPLEPRATSDDSSATLAEFAPDVIIGPAELRHRLKLPNGTTKWLDPYDQTGALLSRPQQSHRLALVVFSGSEARPAGVMISHDALDNHVGCLIRESGITPDDRWSQAAAISSDGCIGDVFASLCGGATIYPIAPGEDPALTIRRLGLTVWNSSATVLEDTIASGRFTTESLASLRLIVLRDKTVKPELVSAIFEAQPGITLLRTYAATEAAASCTLLRLRKDNFDKACQTTVAIGEPVDNMRLHLVGGPSPEKGELVFTGPQIADGYWNDPKATEESFRPLAEGGPLAYFTRQWAERSRGHVFIRPDHWPQTLQ